MRKCVRFEVGGWRQTKDAAIVLKAKINAPVQRFGVQRCRVQGLRLRRAGGLSFDATTGRQEFEKQ
jgi:hypothetical protein